MHCTLFRLVLDVVTIASTDDTYIKKKKKYKYNTCDKMPINNTELLGEKY